MTGHRHWRTFLHNHKLERPLSNVREDWYQQTAEYFWEKQLPGETLIFVCVFALYHRLRQLQLPQFGLLLNCWRVTWISRGRWTAAHRAAFVHEDLAERAAHSYESDARTVYKNKGFLELLFTHGLHLKNFFFLNKSVDFGHWAGLQNVLFQHKIFQVWYK